ncbi:methionine/alanine import family NSS transporter small subunit [Sanguibacter keddieii]|uniref:methionine/alanine import family NSS transporter small subunit n=1 Tax=Sanguibacter keddieii TaxID=60920 RepID=UPI00065FD156|nr:methionine/alanine import family NSS transporter small subunit [Sanguibacter keddieii]
MTAPAIALMILTILLVWGGLVASVVLLQVLSVPSDEETKAAQEAIEVQLALRDQKERYEAYRI